MKELSTDIDKNAVLAHQLELHQARTQTCKVDEALKNMSEDPQTNEFAELPPPRPPMSLVGYYEAITVTIAPEVIRRSTPSDSSEDIANEIDGLTQMLITKRMQFESVEDEFRSNFELIQAALTEDDQP